MKNSWQGSYSNLRKAWELIEETKQEECEIGIDICIKHLSE